jgi:hypothetical protein
MRDRDRSLAGPGWGPGEVREMSLRALLGFVAEDAAAGCRARCEP